VNSFNFKYRLKKIPSINVSFLTLDRKMGCGSSSAQPPATAKAPEDTEVNKLEQEKREPEKRQQEKREQEKLEQEKREQEKREQEKREQEKREQEKREQDKREQEKLEQEKLEQEKREQERKHQELLKLEAENAENEKRKEQEAKEHIAALEEIRRKEKEANKAAAEAIANQMAGDLADKKIQQAHEAEEQAKEAQVLSMVFNNVDVLIYIASFIYDKMLLPFVLTSKSCLEATIASHRHFHVTSLSYFS
jgi:hypothetical protein